MRKTKKGVEWSLQTIGVAILILILVVVLILIFTGYFQKTEPYFSEPIAAFADESCKTRGYQMKLRGALAKENDIDEDERPDYICDSCVCKEKCPNGLSSNNDLDKTGNHIPDGCEDPADQEDRWEEGCKRINRNNAFEGKNDAGKVIILDKKEKRWQCRLI